MDKRQRHGKDEMNLAVLPIAKLGRTDKREIIEYYGTFSDGEGQKEMVWTVRGASGLGLPGELGERILVALFYIGAKEGFKHRRMKFTTRQVLNILGVGDGGGNYVTFERAVAQLAGILITSDKAWIQKDKEGKQRRSRVSKGFHIIDDYALYNTDDEDESYIVWGKRIWQNIQAGYIKALDIDYYYSLENPLSRRLFRFLDKITYHRPSKPYVIDIFALANKLGMVPYEYAAHLKRPLAKAADELVESGYLASYEFFKSGKYNRVRFYRELLPEPVQLSLVQNCDLNCELPDPWLDMIAEMSDSVAEKLNDTKLVGIEDGVATIQANTGADWLNTRLAKSVVKQLKMSGHEVEEVVFVE